MSDTIIVVPCYDEAARFDSLAFERYQGCATFLFVDDGSTDTTGSVLEALSERDPGRFRTLRLSHNSGKAEAVRRGVSLALSEGAAHVGYWDADLATPLDEIDRFREELARDSQLVAVLGSRIRRLGAEVERSAARHYAGRVFATAASALLALPVYDTQCGAKLFRNSERTRAVFAEPFLSRWVFDVEVLARFAHAMREAGENPESAFLELPLTRWHDIPGSKLSWGHAARAAVDLWMIHRDSRRRTRRTGS